VVAAVGDANVLAVTAAALVTALATGLGAAPLAFARTARRSWVGIGNAVAALLMAAASVMLFYEGGRSDAGKTIVGAIIGVVTISVAARWLGKRDSWRFGTLRGAHARVALVFVGVMTLHSVSEGIGVGVAFGDGRSIGFLTALAIAVHNIPEGLAISLVLVPRGMGVLQAAGWSVVSSMPQPSSRCRRSSSWKRLPRPCRSGSDSQAARCSGWWQRRSSRTHSIRPALQKE
jgi:ZIP family zinc transporter